MASPSGGFLSSVKALLLEQGLGKTRANILAKKLESKGGDVVKTLSENTTHILVGSNTRLARVNALLKLSAVPEGVAVLRADWLSACLAKNQLVPEKEYSLLPQEGVTTTTTHTQPAKSISPQTTPTKELPALSPQTTPTKELPALSPSPSKRVSDESAHKSSSEERMLSPKAGMFSVAGRKWAESKSQVAKPKVLARNDSDSDYVESEGEEGMDDKEGGESADDAEAGAPPTKKASDAIQLTPSPMYMFI